MHSFKTKNIILAFVAAASAMLLSGTASAGNPTLSSAAATVPLEQFRRDLAVWQINPTEIKGGIVCSDNGWTGTGSIYVSWYYGAYKIDIASDKKSNIVEGVSPDGYLGAATGWVIEKSVKAWGEDYINNWINGAVDRECIIARFNKKSAQGHILALTKNRQP